LVFNISRRTQIEVFKNRVLRKIFAPERDEVTGDWTKLQNKEPP
jgi:hypothetical protein